MQKYDKIKVASSNTNPVINNKCLISVVKCFNVFESGKLSLMAVKETAIFI